VRERESYGLREMMKTEEEERRRKKKKKKRKGFRPWVEVR
jgi:hypothetical protein